MHTAFALLVAVVLASGCHAGKSPELRVLGVHNAVAHEVVFVQVSNPAKQAMRLTKLTYTFASAGGTVSTGEVPLQRDVPAGSAIVVELPLDAYSKQPMTLHGVLTAELDRIERTFPVEAHVKPGHAGTVETPTDEAKGEPAPQDSPETPSVEASAQPEPTTTTDDAPAQTDPDPAHGQSGSPASSEETN